jgi:Werner syndrome ATP-dependent helicase
MSKSKAVKKLKEVFGYDSFRPNQYEIIKNILDRKDTIAVLPTGYGKSLCFQLPPLLSNQVAIVISPLIALMSDQQSIVEKLGIKSCCFNSSLGTVGEMEVEEKLLNGEYDILYITPESLHKSYGFIQEVYETRGICVFAIDEAHCVSSYGFDFRPKYRDIYKIKEYIGDTPILAITATATDKVILDIEKTMKMRNTFKITASFDRPNLGLNVAMLQRDYITQIKQVIKSPCIIYCITKKETEKLAELLDNAVAYHAGLPTKVREKNQKEFMEGDYDTIVATIAFGMGINKPDIRTVIHFGCPQNIESYYQEIGRAGRDQKASNCYLFYGAKDFVIQRRFIDNIKNNQYRLVRSNLLGIMSNYVYTADCRRKILLKYFGEEYENKSCKNCDNCVVIKKEIDEDLKDDVKIIVSQVYETEKDYKFTFGITTLSLILKGSKSKKISDWMKKLSHYGSLKSMKDNDIKDLIKKSIECRFLINKEVKEGIHVVKCTKGGLKLITV